MRHEQRADTRTCRKLSFTLGIPVWAVTCLSRAMRRRPCWCSPDSPDNGRHLTRSITHCLLSDDSRFCLTEGRRGGRLNLQLRQALYIEDLRLSLKRTLTRNTSVSTSAASSLSSEGRCLRDQLVLCLQFLSFSEAGALVGLRGDGTDLFS